MPGPPPKPAAQRRRRNKTTTARTLRPVEGTPEIPPLPSTVGGKRRGWTKLTRAWWQRVWSSPMATEFDASDVDGLYVLAVLIDDFWRAPSADNAKELRLHRQAYGLTPIDRRRLQWEIDRGEAAAESTRERRKPKATAPVTDPRADAG